ncbi:FAD-binding protein [Variovorax paradoxus]|uniref:FAD-dependent oxidoreductase n=1 Tax=Variovorax paradoxus TaxID=34073 RepID=UPI001ABC0EE2
MSARPAPGEAPAEDGRYDVVVVGYGAAGAAAAIAAHDARLQVLLVAKMPFAGGLSVVSAGGARIAFDAEAATRYLVATCGGRTPEAVLRRLGEGMALLPAWMRSLAREVGATVGVTPAQGNYPFPGFDRLGYVEVQALASGGGGDDDVQDGEPPVSTLGANFFGLLRQCVERRGIELRLGCAARRLLRDAQGAVRGIELEHEGRRLRVGARAGVVLACGGFEANAQMQQQYFETTGVLTASFLGNTGDGIAMAQEVGAQLWHMWHFHGPYGFRHPDPAFRYGLYPKNFPMWTPGHHPGALPRMPWIIVDRQGRRFANEYEPYPGDTGVRHFAHFDPASATHDRLPAYMLLDDAGFRLYTLGKAVANDPALRFRWSEDNTRELALGIFRSAPSVAALAELAGIAPASLARAVDAWNAACDAGADGDFGRRPETMMPLRRAPYYLAEVWPLVINTQGGPAHDPQQRVLDVHGQPIAGLYAAGELGSVFGHVYMAGGNLAECLVGGRHAAEHLAWRRERCPS